MKILTVVIAAGVSILATQHAFGQSFDVQAATYDPAKTNLVASEWVKGAGCPTLAPLATYPATKPTGTYSDPACTTGDNHDNQNAGLVMVKTGPISNDAASGANINGLNGKAITELGFDIRADGYCSGGSPRFDLLTSDGVFHFIGGCANGTKTTNGSTEWVRVRFDLTNPAQAFPPVAPGATVKQIDITFDEPGQAIVDNIEANGTLVGKQ